MKPNDVMIVRCTLKKGDVNLRLIIVKKYAFFTYTTMAAPIMALRAKGPQDTFLTVEPEITYWKTSHARHTNFALEDNYMTERTGTMNFGGEMKFPLQRTGDLVTNLTLHMEISEVKFSGYSTENFLINGQGHAVGKVFADDLGRALIDYVELTIGHYKIEKLTGDFMHIQDRMMRPKDRSFVDTCKTEHGGVNKFETHEVEDFHGSTPDDYYKYLFPYTQVAKPSDNQNIADPDMHEITFGNDNDLHMAHATGYDKYQGFSTKNSKVFPNVNRGDKTQHIYIPLQFSNTSNNHGQALPVIALQYHNVEIAVRLRQLDEVSCLSRDGKTVAGSSVTVTQSPTVRCELLGRYVFLDDYERRLFATSTHEFLITETTEMSFPVQSGKKHDLTLHFNHPTKALYTFIVPDKHRERHETSGAFCTKYWNWVWDAEQHKENESIKNMNLKINGQNLYSNEGRDSQYFGWLLPAQVHSRVPDKRDRVYVMPFCLEPESWKPTGSINMSRLDTVILSVETTGNSSGSNQENGTLWVYGRNFNILKITSGMGGKRFAS